MNINDEGNFVPNNTIIFINQSENKEYDISDIIEPLKGKNKRDYFSQPFYYCLPLLIANQSGFVVKAAHDLEVYWSGGEAPAAIKKINNKNVPDSYEKIQEYFTNFRSGIISIENAFIFRTPPGINLMTIQPPNYFIRGIHSMSGVVEADNLRRSFTFNLKITEPNKVIKIKKGDWLSAFVPTPRYFIDSFSMESAEKFFDKNCIDNELSDIKKLQYERNNSLENGGDIGKPNDSGRRYFKGINVDDSEFKDHQKRIL